MSISDHAPRDLGPADDLTGALDVLDVDPRLSLGELVRVLGEIAGEGDPVRAELARRTFEALTERPEAHFDALMRTVPRVASPPPLRRSPLAPVGPSDLSRSLVQRMGPETEAERAALEEDA